MNIQKIDLGFYEQDFLPFVNVTCNSFVNRLKNEPGIILGCYSESEPIGVCVVSFRKKDLAVVYYINVKEEYRNKGFGSALLERAIEEIIKRGVKRVECDVVLATENGEIMQHILSKRGFVVEEIFTSYKCLTDKETRARWFDFIKNRGERILKRAESHGFRVTTFDKLSKEEKEEFKNNFDKTFPESLNPFDIYKEIIEDMSFAALKDGKVVAYIAARLINISPLVIEVSYLSISEHFKKSSVFGLVLLNFVSKTFDNEDSYISFCIDRDNAGMMRSAEGFLKIVIRSVKKQLIFRNTLI